MKPNVAVSVAPNIARTIAVPAELFFLVECERVPSYETGGIEMPRRVSTSRGPGAYG
jgi:hypothetical protein